MLILDSVKYVCSSGMASLSTCPLNHENFKGVTSVMLKAVCGPEHMHKDGGDVHGNIYDSDSDEGNSDEDGYDIGIFALEANAAEIDLSDDKNSNGCGDSSDGDAGKKNQSDNDEEELDPSILDNLILDDSDDELTEHHTGAYGSPAQLIKKKQDTRKSARMEKDKA